MADLITLKPDEVFTFENDIQASATLAYNAIKRYRETPCKYSDSEEGLRSFQEQTERYFLFVQKANEGEHPKAICADIEGWTTFLGITRATLANYHNKRSDEWKAYIDFAKEAILSMKKQFMLNGRTSPVSAIFDLTNNHGYLNASTFTPKIYDKPTVSQNITVDDFVKLTKRI